MKIRIIAVGSLKEDYLKEALQHYSREIGKRVPCEVLEVPDEGVPDKYSRSEVEKIKVREGLKILSHIKDHSFVFALDIQGKKYRTSDLQRDLRNNINNGRQEVIFIIGGSHGLSPQVLRRADGRISFSPMTFPHQLMRIILCEQIGRCLASIN